PLPGRDRPGDAGAGAQPRAGGAAAVAARGAARPGDDRPEVPPEGGGPALPDGARVGGGPGAVPARRAGAGAAGRRAGARPALAATYFLTAVALILGSAAAGAVWLWRDAEAARGRAEVLQTQAEEARKGEATANETLDQVLYLQRVQLAQREWLAGNVTRC